MPLYESGLVAFYRGAPAPGAPVVPTPLCLLDMRVVLLPGVHDVSGYSNILFSVNCSKNLVLTALDRQVGATISCNGLTGFAFTHATNLSIHGLTFENCEFLSTQHLWHISLSVEYAMDIDINNVVIRGIQEIGLFIGNSHGTINVIKLHLWNNAGHFYFLINEDQHAGPGLVSRTARVTQNASTLRYNFS